MTRTFGCLVLALILSAQMSSPLLADEKKRQFQPALIPEYSTPKWDGNDGQGQKTTKGLTAKKPSQPSIDQTFNPKEYTLQKSAPWANRSQEQKTPRTFIGRDDGTLQMPR